MRTIFPEFSQVNNCLSVLSDLESQFCQLYNLWLAFSCFECLKYFTLFSLSKTALLLKLWYHIFSFVSHSLFLPSCPQSLFYLQCKYFPRIYLVFFWVSISGMRSVLSVCSFKPLFILAIRGFSIWLGFLLGTPVLCMLHLPCLIFVLCGSFVSCIIFFMFLTYFEILICWHDFIVSAVIFLCLNFFSLSLFFKKSLLFSQIYYLVYLRIMIVFF